MSRQIKCVGGKHDGKKITIEGDDFLPITYGVQIPYVADDGLSERETYVNSGEIEEDGTEIWRSSAVAQ